MISESLLRLAAGLLSALQTRVELAATEVEEEALRYFSYLLQSLAAMFFLALAIVLATFLLVLLYWDTHRIGILTTLTLLFAAIGIFTGLRVRSRYRGKPPLLDHTAVELARDTELLQPPA
jgi:uncharacterized membrane protein YqjE